MPTKTELDQMADALISNGLDFIEKSASELQREPKFSVSHFATGVELLLKARLFREHWSLVSTNPHATAWTAIKDGTFTTAKASDLTGILTTLTGTRLAALGDILDDVFKHRNQALHFVPSQKVADIAAEQFRAWYYLHRLFEGPWSQLYGAHGDRINAVDESLRSHRKCLEVRFEELTKVSRFLGPARAGLLIDCPVCEHHSGELSHTDSASNEEDVILTDLKCLVCLTSCEVVDFGCGNWHSFSDGIYDSVPCTCGAGEHTAQELARAMDENPVYGEDALIDGPSEAHCGECLIQDCVVSHGSGYRCFACGTDFEPAARSACEWCNEPWVGYSGGDGWNGCELCDGHSGWVKDD